MMKFSKQSPVYIEGHNEYVSSSKSTKFGYFPKTRYRVSTKENIPYGQSSAKLSVIWSSSHPVIKSSSYPVIQLSIIKISGHLVIQSSVHPVI